MTKIPRTLVRQTLEHVGEEVMVEGWVNTKRDHGKLTFVDLRDRTGIMQCVGFQKMGELTVESVVRLVGIIKKRPEKMVNPQIETGTVEMDVTRYEVLGSAQELPMPLDTDGYEVGEEVRLAYRYLDLRRQRLYNTLKLRSDFLQNLREGLLGESFIEVETPILTKSTMEGARDFLVPSRFQPGKFYALPQSPQQYKQLLMVAGIERYFQFPRCFRDEDLRADRGFEFTQLDLEMSFVDREMVMTTVEDIVKAAVKAVGGRIKQEKFPVLTYAEAMERFGADKFDMRTGEEQAKNILAFAWVVDFPFFKKVDKKDAAEMRDSKSGWTFTHNPFSAPKPEHEEWLLNGEHVGEILTTQYDLVCNGYEVGGGSVRAHTPELLRATYKIMGYSEEQIEESVGHMLTALSYGAPPNGGIALGIDRLVAILRGEQSIKETIAFPMTSTGRTAVMDAPSKVSDEQLKEIGLKISE